MSENKGTYVFNHRLLNKRIEELKKTPPSEKDRLITKLIDLSDQLAAMAGVMMVSELDRPTYSDEEVRELARHLNSVVKSCESDPFRPYFNHTAISDAREFLQSKKYFNLNQSDIIV